MRLRTALAVLRGSARELRTLAPALPSAGAAAAAEIAADVAAALPSKAADYAAGESDRRADAQNPRLTLHQTDATITDGNSYEPDILIPVGVGAKAKDILVLLPDGTEVPLTPGSRITGVEVIGGRGRNRQIDEIDGLLSRYPGTKESEWQKKKGVGYVEYHGESYKADIHFYEEPTVGRVRFKLKPDAGGNWFYEGE